MSVKHLLSAYFMVVLMQPVIVAPTADASAKRMPPSEEESPVATALKSVGESSAGVSREEGSPEGLLMSAFSAIEQNQLDVAERRIDAVLAEYPNFRLAQMVKGDVLFARGNGLDRVGESLPEGAVAPLEAEARARVKAVEHVVPPAALPADLIQVGKGLRHVFVVDASVSRLYVFENRESGLARVADFYITVGKNGVAKEREGDKRSPKGVYFVTSKIAADRLDDFYGVGAFPLNYPNEWDQRLGRDGHGIWLHGTPSDTYSRPPQASDGCVVLANADLATLAGFTDPGQTPVVISDHIDWRAPADSAGERSQLAAALESWRKAWESRDNGGYLGHYDSAQFMADGLDYGRWAAQKRLVNASKEWIKIQLDDVSMFRYPGREDLVVVTFDQHYQSNNLTNEMRKKQYWQNRGGQWRIIYEGAA